MDEHDIHHDYTKGDLNFQGAILRLQKLGYLPQDAKALVNEWADAAEYDEQMGGY